MALSNLLVALVAVGLVSGGVAYGEFHEWRGVASWALYGVSGFVCAEFVAAPLMADLLGLRSGWIESLSMSLALGVGLAVVCKFVAGGQDEQI